MALKQQRGNTLVGFIIGLVVGLTIALGLAIYVTKMPIPFMNKGQTRSSEADSAEDKKKTKTGTPTHRSTAKTQPNLLIKQMVKPRPMAKRIALPSQTPKAQTR